MKRVSKLNMAEIVKVMSWITRHRKELLEERPDLHHLAGRILKETNGEIRSLNATNLRAVLKSVGIHFSAPRRVPGGNFLSYGGKVRVIAHQVDKICQEMGLQNTPEFGKMMDLYREDSDG